MGWEKSIIPLLAGMFYEYGCQVVHFSFPEFLPQSFISDWLGQPIPAPPPLRLHLFLAPLLFLLASEELLFLLLVPLPSSPLSVFPPWFLLVFLVSFLSLGSVRDDIKSKTIDHLDSYNRIFRHTPPPTFKIVHNYFQHRFKC